MGLIIYRCTALLAAVFLVACGKPDGRSARPSRNDSELPGATTGAAPVSPAQGDSRPVILFVGTSLTAGLGVDRDSAFPAVIQRRIDSQRRGWRVVNAGVSGETSAGALRRMSWLLREPSSILVLETGANDGLRGLDVDSTRANINEILRLVRERARDEQVLLVGMEAPPNMGRRFATRFRALYLDLARRNRLSWVPFLLEGVGGIDSLNQADGIHPTPAGHRIVAGTVWKALEPMLSRPVAASRGALANRMPR